MAAIPPFSRTADGVVRHTPRANEIGIDRAVHGLGDQPAMFGPAQRGLIARVGHEAHFHQHAGNVGRLQDDKSGMSVGVLQHRQVAVEAADEAAGDPHGSGSGFLAHQAGEDMGDLGRGVLPLPSDEAVGAVFLARQGGGLRVGGGLRQRIDGCAAHRMVRQRIGVHRDEQRRAVRWARSTRSSSGMKTSESGSVPPDSVRRLRVDASVPARSPGRRFSHTCRRRRSRRGPCRRGPGSSITSGGGRLAGLGRHAEFAGTIGGVASAMVLAAIAPCKAGGSRKVPNTDVAGRETAQQQATRNGRNEIHEHS